VQFVGNFLSTADKLSTG